MADNNLEGIDIGDRADNQPDTMPDVSDFLDQLEIGDLSQLTQSQRELIRAMTEEEESLEGISQEPEGGERGAQMAAQRARVAAATNQEEILQQQLEELEEVQTDTELLKRLAASTATTNDLLQTTNTILGDVTEAIQRGEALVVKDADQISFDRANNTRDVVDEDDISTSVVLVKADASNDGTLFLGTEGVEVGNGFQMEAGEQERFQIDVLADKFQIVSSDADDTYTYIALGST